jgi:hypothetical protein
MRRGWAIGAAICALASFVTLSACKREPSFDERYAGAQKAIREKSSELDQDMARRAAEAKALEQNPSDDATDGVAGNI